jgi:hypothetical protein
MGRRLDEEYPGMLVQKCPDMRSIRSRPHGRNMLYPAEASLRGGDDRALVSSSGRRGDRLWVTERARSCGSLDGMRVRDSNNVRRSHG